jgi:predicted RNA binding protein YcfA (HicA-like mRNA interferase family)
VVGIAGVPHRRAVRALEKAGFRVAREGRKHIVMTAGQRLVTIPRHDPVNALTMAGIVRDAGLSEDEFRKLL